MTFTSEERREMAENLRHLTIGHSIQYKEQFFDELAEVLDVIAENPHRFIERYELYREEVIRLGGKL